MRKLGVAAWSRGLAKRGGNNSRLLWIVFWVLLVTLLYSYNVWRLAFLSEDSRQEPWFQRKSGPQADDAFPGLIPAPPTIPLTIASKNWRGSQWEEDRRDWVDDEPCSREASSMGCSTRGRSGGVTTRGQGDAMDLADSSALAAEEAVEARAELDDVCKTTFNRDALPEEEKKLLVFSAPPPLNSLPASMKSWDSALRGRGRLVVFANDRETRRVCKENKIPLVCIENVDEGLPRVDKMFERMHDLQPEGVVGFVNSDITVQNFDPMIEYIDTLKGVQIKQVRPVELYEPFEETGYSSDYWFLAVNRLDVSHSGVVYSHDLGGYDFWAWNTRLGGAPFLPIDIPPFRFPYAIYDNWILDMSIQTGLRNVIDATAILDIFHHEHKRVSDSTTWYDALLKGVTGVYMNRYFGFHEPRKSTSAGSSSDFRGLHHVWTLGTSEDAPFFASKDVAGNFVTLRRKYWSTYSEKQLKAEGCVGPFAEPSGCKTKEAILKGTRRAEHETSLIPLVDNNAQSKIETAAALSWRYTLEEQLKIHATEDGFVMLVGVNFSYRDHLMNFMCSLERVGMSDHLIIAAFDEDMYRWGVRFGLPIYKPQFSIDLDEWLGNQGGGGEYGSTRFRRITKLKSRAVLEILNAGYSVVWSDVDITWFVHPFDALAGFMKREGGIAIQSNAPYVANPDKEARPHKTVDLVVSAEPTGECRFNSGLYVAPNNPLVRAAFEEIIAHAANSQETEQRSFDAILSARETSTRLSASSTYKPGSGVSEATRNELGAQFSTATLHVEVLDRFRYPNGAVLIGDDNENVYTAGKERFEEYSGAPLFLAHNNWIKGKDLKKKRQQDAGWWFIDSRHSCEFLKEEQADLYLV